MQEIDSGHWNHPEANVKMTLATRAVPLDRFVHLAPLESPPQVGDVVLTSLNEMGRHKRIENREAVTADVFTGDRLIAVFGNRYATDQYEGSVPEHRVETCDLLSVGGVCGQLVSRHGGMPAPTKLRLIGAVCDDDGRPLNTRDFGMMAPVGRPAFERPQTILVVGASMNAGKTTMVGTITRALRQHGCRVAAAKVTGTASGKDTRFFSSCGARPVLDFVDAGFPSTYMLDREALESLYFMLLDRLRSAKPDYIVLELADGIVQRETRMLLESSAVLDSVDHCVFAAGDSLSIQSGVRLAEEMGLPLRATGGVVSQSILGMKEAEVAGGVVCLSIERMMAGEFVDLLDRARRPAPIDGVTSGAMPSRVASRNA